MYQDYSKSNVGRFLRHSIVFTLCLKKRPTFDLHGSIMIIGIKFRTVSGFWYACYKITAGHSVLIWLTIFTGESFRHAERQLLSPWRLAHVKMLCGVRQETVTCSVQYLILFDAVGEFVRFSGIFSLLTDWLQRTQCSHCKRCISYGNSVRPSVRLSVCLSVCPSVTRRFCVKTTARIARCSLHSWIAKCV